MLSCVHSFGPPQGSGGSQGIGAWIAPEAPFIVYLVPSFDFPPVEHGDAEPQIAHRDIEALFIIIFEGLFDAGIETLRLQSNGRAAPTFPPHQPPQLPPLPLPKTKKSFQIKRGVMMSLPIPRVKHALLLIPARDCVKIA